MKINCKNSQNFVLSGLFSISDDPSFPQILSPLHLTKHSANSFWEIHTSAPVSSDAKIMKSPERKFNFCARAFEFRSNWSKMLFVHNMHSVLMSNLFHLNKTSKRIAFESYDANNFWLFQQEASWGGVTKFMVFERLENIGLDLLMVFKLACWIDSQCSRPVHVGVD